MEVSQSWSDLRLVSAEWFSRGDSRGHLQRKEVTEWREKMIAKRLEERGRGRAMGRHRNQIMRIAQSLRLILGIP